MNALPDSRIRRALLPTRIVQQTGEVEGADNLLLNDWGQALAQAVPCCTLNNKAGILLDFGRELNGGLQLVTGALADGRPLRARLRFGESVSEALNDPSNDHAIHDYEILITSMASQEYGQTGFRFAHLILLEDGTLPLVAARAITLEREPEAVGTFQCSDERLNEIWRVGAETVRLCLQDFIWDGVKRDRLVWMGDLHPEVSVVSTVWGDLDIVPQSLDWVRDQTPLVDDSSWMNTIGSYSLWWIIIQRDWYRAHGDKEYLEAQRGYLVALLKELLTQVGADGRMAWRGLEFLDWPSSENPAAVKTGLHALFVLTLQAAAEICEALGEAASVQSCRDALQLLTSGKPLAAADSKQASALLSLAGLANANQINSEILARDPLQGISTFYGYYVLQARAAAGDYAGCLEVIRKYWGAMLDLGATTFWEHFELDWTENASRIDELPEAGKHDVHAEYGAYCFTGYRHSFCHGWAAGPTAWLSQHVLGVQSLDAPNRRIVIKPHLADLEWVEGTFPTPSGPLKISHRRVGEKIETHVAELEGWEIVLA